MRTAPTFVRASFAALFALLLAIRLIAPVGFMPAFEHGAVTIVSCPDAGMSEHAPGHHHGNSRTLHQPCPYAAASAADSLTSDLAPLVAVLVLSAALLLGRTFLFLERNSLRERPPTRGPPLAA